LYFLLTSSLKQKNAYGGITVFGVWIDLLLVSFVSNIGSYLLWIFIIRIAGTNPEKFELDYQRLRKYQGLGSDVPSYVKKERSRLQHFYWTLNLLMIGVDIGVGLLIQPVFTSYSAGLLPFDLISFGSGWEAVLTLYSIFFIVGLDAAQRIYYRLKGGAGEKGEDEGADKDEEGEEGEGEDGSEREGKSCPICGTMNRENAEWCVKCGDPL